MNVTFLGLGIMGSRMAAQLIKPGVQLTVYNRDPQKSEPLISLGALGAKSIQDAVTDADVVFTMLSTPQVVEAMVTGAEGFLTHMKQGAIWVDCTTVAPEDVRNFKNSASDQGISYLEAPVAGTKQPAENGELVFFVGGDEAPLAVVGDLLEHMGKKTVHMGEHGKGASIKILINLLLAQSMLAFSEAVSLGSSLGMGEQKVMDILLSTPVTAPFLQLVRNKLTEKDVTPNFPIQWMLKDLGLVQRTSKDHGLSLASAKAAEEQYRLALESGLENQDFSSIFHFYHPS